jgi:GLPGLI family protein
MKIFAGILVTFSFSMISFCSYAQKQITEGSLLYKISIESGKSETPVVNSLNGADLTLYLKPYASRTEMKSTLGVESTVYDNRSATGYILKEYSGQKLMISMNEANWSQKNKMYENLVFSTSDEIVAIGEYKCRKATAMLADGKVFTVYYDPTVQISNRKYNNAFSKLPGLPVQYELQSGNLNFKYTLVNINYDAVPQSKFEAPKTGYRVMTYEENQQLKKGN